MTLDDMLRDYPHLQFRRSWTLNDTTTLNLGQCVAIINCLCEMPIDPLLQQELRHVAFERGAQATTAIEGNTLTDEELRKVIEGRELPKSRAYQAQEVVNALDAMEFVWKSIVEEGHRHLVEPKLLCDLNRIVGRNLGQLFDGVPGRPRNDRRHVGRYLAPPPEHVEALMSQMCEWLRAEFGYASGRQTLQDAIVEAIVAHVYFEWIHPFADGNGRTGRLVEFFILLRAGLPDIAAHVLANHYNNSRSEYAAHFETARRQRDLSEFIAYAIQGLLDGLVRTQAEANKGAFRVTWKAHIYDIFDGYSPYKKTVFKRRRRLALSMPIDAPFTAEELIRRSDDLLREYMGSGHRKLQSDIDTIRDLGLIVDIDGKYRAATEALMQQNTSSRAAAAATQRSQNS